MSQRPRRLLALVAVLLGLLTFTVGSAHAADTVRLYGAVTGSGSASVTGTDVVVRTSSTQTTVAQAKVAADGTYEVTGLAPGTYDVRLTPPAGSGYGATLVTSERIESDRRLDLQLVSSDSAVLTGTVRDSAGRTLPDAYVALGSTTVRADADGRYALAVAAGAYTLSVGGNPRRADGTSAGNLSMNASVELRGARELDVVLPVRSLLVRAVGPSGSPVPQAYVQNLPVSDKRYGPGDGPEVSPGVRASRLYVGPNGAAANDEGIADLMISPEATGPITGEVVPPPTEDLARRTFSLDAFADPGTVHDVRLAPAYRISGTVRDSTGRTLSDVYVALGGTTVQADGSGRYSLAVGAGAYTLMVSGSPRRADNTSAGRLTVDATVDVRGSRDLDVVIPVGGLRVRAVAPSGAPVAGALVQNLPSSEKRYGDGRGPEISAGLRATRLYVGPNSASTDAAGIADLMIAPDAEGPITGEVAPPASEDLAKRSFSLTTLGDATTVHDVELQPAYRVFGTVRDSAGRPLAGAYVMLGTTTVNADAGGRYSVAVAAGTATMSVSGNSRRADNSTAGALALDASVDVQGTRELNLVVPVGALRVRVVGPSGSPITGASVQGLPPSDRRYGPGDGPEVSPGVRASRLYVAPNSAQTDAAGTADLMIAADARGPAGGRVVAPVDTTLPTTEFSVADLSVPTTKVISFSRSATDPTPPSVVCDTSGAGVADGTWSSQVPRITCTSTDDGTGLADPKDQTVTVTPQVPGSGEYEGTYPAVVKVCDKADNCTEKTVPVNVDTKAPTIESSTPGNGATYTQGQDVEVHYSCKDGGSGVKVCKPAQPGAPGTGTGSTGGGEAGTKLDTSTPGKYVVYIECTDAAGNTRTEKVEYEVVAPAASAPVSTTAPTLSGTPHVGVSLSSSLGGWMGTAPITFARQWQRCDAAGDGCADIGGATGTTYVPVAADVDRRLRVVVTATNEKGTASRASDPSAMVAAIGGFSPNANAQIDVQKAQAFQSLPAGETRDIAVACPAGTRVVDGSPLVQAVDQDRGTRSDVLVRSSRPVGDGGWTASVENPTTGQAQVQLFASCIGTRTGAGGRMDLTDARVATVSLAAGGIASRTLQCAPGSVAIAPSFDLGSADARVVSSEPAANGGSWSFAVRASDDGSVDLGVRCLSTSLSDGSRLVVASQSSTTTIGARDRRTASLDVGDGRAAIAAGFTVPADGSVTMLGREPQGRNALFTYENVSGVDGPVSQTALVLSIVASSPDPTVADPTPAPVAAAGGASSAAALAAPTAAASEDSTAPGAAAAGSTASPNRPSATSDRPSASRATATGPIALTAPAAVRAASLSRGMKITVRLAEAGTVTTVVTDGARRVSTTTTRARAGASTVEVAIPKKVRARLGRPGHCALKVTVTLGRATTMKVVRVSR
ncbi:hypothetical protein [Patulibacter sp.]|uniref:hypothetical protein n=1 Tax=Patulibacter sp. TaxID=1912859 RepID=UPI00271A54B4|nr:hypothetical protein [Patulibacter sp.]MDO9407876.1 hypothetical protein [Patulibacter sp.]